MKDKWITNKLVELTQFAKIMVLGPFSMHILNCHPHFPCIQYVQVLLSNLPIVIVTSALQVATYISIFPEIIVFSSVHACVIPSSSVHTWNIFFKSWTMC